MGVKTSVWGPSCWQFLFCVALNYDDNNSPDKLEKYKQFFHALGDVLPCSTCVSFYEELLKEYPFERVMESVKERYACFAWVYHIKDCVNKKLIKQEKECGKSYTKESPPFEVVLKRYLAFKSPSQTTGKCTHVP